jgi:hypothetical protein
MLVPREALGPRLDAQHALAHEEDVEEVHGELLRKQEGVGPVVAVAHACDQARVLLVDRVEVPEPGACGVVRAPEHPARFREVLAVHGRPGAHGEVLADLEVLVFGQDVPGAGLAAVVDPVVAVPAGAAPADLHEPWPDLLWRRFDGHRSGGVPRGLGDDVVVREGTSGLLGGSAPVHLVGSEPADVGCDCGGECCPADEYDCAFHSNTSLKGPPPTA